MTTSPITAVELVLDCADRQEARRISDQLLKRRLIAASSILSKDNGSRWADVQDSGSPVTLITVTRAENAGYVSECISRLMDKPVKISATPVERPYGGTIEWVDTANSVGAAKEGN